VWWLKGHRCDGSVFLDRSLKSFAIDSEFLKTRALQFARDNPSVEVVVTARPNRHPCIRAYYRKYF
jgi:hypothetical protein